MFSFATSCSDSDDNDGKEVDPPEDGKQTTLTDLICLKKNIDENSDCLWDKDMWQIDLENIDNPNNYNLSGVTWNMNTKRVSSLRLEKVNLCPKPLDLTPLTALDSVILYRENMSEILLPATSTLTYLQCEQAQRITKAVDVSKLPNLKTLWFADNRDLGNDDRPVGGVFDLSNNLELVTLYCENNYFTEVKFEKCTKLEYVSLFWNKLKAVDFSNQPNLIEADVAFGEGDKLDYLDVSKNLKLEVLQCNGQLTDIDVSNNVNLKELYVSGNKFTNLDISNNVNLELLRCANSNLSNLDLSKNTKLESLFFYKNDINTIDLSHNPLLKVVECFNNNMTSLDLSHNPLLTELDCNTNQLTDLDLTNNIFLKRLFCTNNKFVQNSVSVCQTTWNKWTITYGDPIKPERTNPIYNVVSCN